MEKDNFLGRWLTDDISEEEKKEFENSKDYLAYKDILKGVDKFDRPVFDLDKGFKNQKEYNKTYKKTSEKKVIKLRPWLYAAAAAIVVLFGLRTVFFSTTEIYTEMAETKTLTLPDNSLVTLNADSSVEYDKRSFAETRIIHLKGEAFFDVAKGSSFTVKTKNGDVTVLGTEFNVYSRNEHIEVQCFEGKVRVSNSKETVILTPGKAIKSNSEGALSPQEIKESKPSWMQGKSTFNQVTLQQLIQELERQYDIRITANDIDTKRLFSGFFIHSDLDKALKTCFEPMNISYTVNNQQNISLKNK
ncbi:FecR domain-containing protein [Aquimarina sp. MMG015]|uniref:FecR family protein n=1 Tax=Aquimarina sp. MMG015 TaxID=2822689 RepID=UPI001B3A5324|nr:FecR domain-containing protein [Aquimarina sp. MMG015]MBQ4802671.1 FecR domain-containing protein [Aquimarina sp. MMG015]